MYNTVRLALNAALNTHYQQNKIDNKTSMKNKKNDTLALTCKKKVSQILVLIPNSLQMHNVLRHESRGCLCKILNPILDCNRFPWSFAFDLHSSKIVSKYTSFYLFVHFVHFQGLSRWKKDEKNCIWHDMKSQLTCSDARNSKFPILASKIKKTYTLYWPISIHQFCPRLL